MRVSRLTALPAGVVDVWCVQLDTPAWPYETLVAVLDSREHRHAARMRHGSRAWACGRGARRLILSSYLEIGPAALHFTESEFGKPRLAGDFGLQFNSARSGDCLVVVVAGDREVGVDVEQVNPHTDIDFVAREILPLDEAVALACTPPVRRRNAFFDAWVRHEARLKRRGLRLGDRIPEEEGSCDDVRLFDLRPGFAAAVAAPGRDWTIRYRTRL